MDIKGTEVASFDEKPETGSGTINGGFFVMEPAFVDRYFEDRDDISLEHDALRAAAADGEVMVWQHEGFWQPMDTYREWRIFEDMWNDGQAAWKVW
jgi:glucose-1-phosphate cytidylyltransferase